MKKSIWSISKAKKPLQKSIEWEYQYFASIKYQTTKLTNRAGLSGYQFTAIAGLHQDLGSGHRYGHTFPAKPVIWVAGWRNG